MLVTQTIPRALAAGRRMRAQARRSNAAEELPAGERWALARTDRLLAERPRAAAAVVTGARASHLARLLQLGHPGARITVAHAATATTSQHAALAAAGPFLAIVVTIEAAARSDLARLFRTLLFHLEPRGQLIFADARPGQPAPSGLWPTLHRLVALRDPDAEPPIDADERSLAAATSQVTLVGRRIAVVRAGTGLAKLREPEVDQFLRLRGAATGQVLERIGAETYESRAVIRDHREHTKLRLRPAISVPPLSLREYHGAVVAPRQITVLDNVLLPDTYRHPLRRRLTTTGTAEVSPLFATVDADLDSARPVDFPVFQLDSEWNGHFGHLMTEQLARLWGWPAAKARHPELRAVIHKKRDTDPVAPWERGLFEAAGIDPGDVLVIAAPIRPTAVLAATPMFSQPEYASPRLAETWDLVGQQAQRTAGRGPHKRVFLTRTQRGRLCHNRDVVEQRFRDAGFAVVAPEGLPFAEQVVLLRDAEVVAGFAGSAMFTLALCDTPKRVLLVCSEGYIPHNEYLISAVRGHELDIFWSEPDTRKVNAPFTFDLGREGRHLKRVLHDLGPA